MSSSDIAIYLYEVGANQRKLQYCRQILASNPNFIPEAIFNLNCSQLRSTISKNEFVELVKSFNISSTQQQIELTFTYFQIDGKSYITFDQFSTLITPQIDSSLKSLISRRSGDQFNLDYSLRYCLQKFFFQIIQNQVRLQLLCKFTFEKQNDDKRIKYKKLTADIVKQFLSHHAKFPSQTQINLILKEVGLNKGQCKRNRLIGEFIIGYNEKKKDNLQVPKVFQRELSAMADISKKYQSTIENQQQKIANSKIESPTKLDKSQYGSKINPLVQLQYNQIKESGGKVNVNAFQFQNNISNVYQVQDRIKSLMGSINLNSKLASSKKSQKQQDPSKSNIKQTIQNIKEDLKKQKEQQKSINSKNNKSVSRKLQFKPQKQSIIGQIYSIDNRSQRRDIASKSIYESQLNNDKNRTERVYYQKNKRITQDNFQNQSNASSHLQIKKSKVSQKTGKYGQGESKKRMEYLRSLIDSSQDKREAYMRKYQV